MNTKSLYMGKRENQPKPGEIYNQQITFPYLPSDGLVEAVNLAIALKRPLLLKGEPGCGKTRLALAVAYELRWDYYEWHVKSTSRARDGLYVYDTVGRLRDAQLAALRHGSLDETEEAKPPEAYVRYGPLGQAFLQEDNRSVVLIDEIDKADIDFPNDLLLELDQLRFVVEETRKIISASREHPPFIIVTSNDEKDLPGAFLRRCVFHPIEFPDAQHLADIINARFEDPDQKVVNAAIDRFNSLRDSRERFVRKPSTSELIDWFTILNRYPEDKALERLKGVLPFHSLLLKNWDDHRRFLAGNK